MSTLKLAFFDDAWQHQVSALFQEATKNFESYLKLLTQLEARYKENPSDKRVGSFVALIRQRIWTPDAREHNQSILNIIGENTFSDLRQEAQFKKFSAHRSPALALNAS